MIYPKNYSIPQNETHFTGELSIMFFVLNNEKLLTAEEWLKENQGDLWDKTSEFKKITIDGVDGIEFMPTKVMGEQKHVLLTKDGKVYIILGYGTNEILNSTFDQTIATFKFIN